ncbi:hypothetical protein AGMMS49543_27950 [Betaproteobacteria bacterium]|nr:hypothetical protein AGMMS49543_27950 [Betaproteobacteria bacterium]
MLTLTAPPPDAIRTLADAMVRLTRTDVFFSTLAFALNPQFTDDPTMTTACTDGVRVLLNPQFFTRLSVSEQVALLKHEVMHVAFEHVFRRGDRHPKRWNIACDYVINLIIKQEGGALPGGGLCDEQYEGLIEEEVYERLPEGIEDRFDLGDLRESEDGLSPEERAALRASVRERVLQAAQVARMTQENLPAGIERYLNEILQPQQDWHELLAEYLTAQEKSDYDWMHPNRRNSVLQS